MYSRNDLKTERPSSATDRTTNCTFNNTVAVSHFEGCYFQGLHSSAEYIIEAGLLQKRSNLQ